MKRFALGMVAAVAAIALCAQPAMAGRKCGGCSPCASACDSGCGSCGSGCGNGCAPVAAAPCTTVKRTVMVPTWTTVEKDVVETVMQMQKQTKQVTVKKPVWETKEVTSNYTVMVPVRRPGPSTTTSARRCGRTCLTPTP